MKVTTLGEPCVHLPFCYVYYLPLEIKNYPNYLPN